MKKLTTIVTGALFLALAAGAQQAGAGGSPPADAFKCYPLTGKKLNPQPLVSLDDQFEVDQARVIEPDLICNPANLGSGILDSSRHYACFTIRGLKALGAPVKVRVTNIFGTQDLTVRKPETLLCTVSDKDCLGKDAGGAVIPVPCPNEP